MSNITKKELHDLTERMPEGFTLEDLQYRLFILQKLEKAEEQIEKGINTSNLSEMKNLLKQWRSEKESKIK
ncbi:MAG: hypothetical protein BAJALOKI2v1_100061 [Promethearchaeota archaeon]|nr:MAG: hypothetical protein BAJALOKI2v1_100061 [Candidatus Lokiarchaeota archaeon]